jgi:hypothetical protein
VGSDRADERRQVAVDDLALQRKRGRGNDDGLLPVERVHDRWHEVGQRLAGAGACLHQEVLAGLHRVRDGIGHLDLAGPLGAAQLVDRCGEQRPYGRLAHGSEPYPPERGPGGHPQGPTSAARQQADVAAELRPPSVVGMPLPPLIPRSVLFGNPDRVSPSLSPDGTRLAFIAPDEGVLNVWVGPADSSETGPPGDPRPAPRRPYVHLLSRRPAPRLPRGHRRDENWRLSLLDLDTGEHRLVTPEEGVHAQVLAHNRWHPTTMLIGLNADNPQLHDVWRLDLATGELTKEARQPRLRRLARRHGAGRARWGHDAARRVDRLPATGG